MNDLFSESSGFLEPYLGSWMPWLYVDHLAWTIIGFMGAGLFGSRFFYQWFQSERHQKLVVPTLFWHLSFWGSSLNLCYMLHVDKAPLVIGNFLLPFLYGRNLYLLYHGKGR